MKYQALFYSFLLSVGLFLGVSAVSAASAPWVLEPQARAVVDLYDVGQLEWTKVPGAVKYDVQIRCSDCGEYDVDAPNATEAPVTYGWRFTVSKNMLTLPRELRNNLFRFRVRARLANGTYTDYSSYRYFEVNSASYRYSRSPYYFYDDNEDRVIDTKTTITSPKDNATLYRGNTGVDVEWKRLPGALQYELELTCKTCASGVAFWQDKDTYVTTRTNLTLNSNTLSETDFYRVRVRPIFSKNRVGAWSSYVYFHYDEDRRYIAPRLNVSVSDTLIRHNEDPLVTITARTQNGTRLDKIELFADGKQVHRCLNTASCTDTINVLNYERNGRVLVRAIGTDRGVEREIFSTSVSIRVDDVDRLEQPKISRPNQNSVVRGSSVFFSWSQISGREQYKVMIDCFGCGRNSWKTVETEYTTNNRLTFYPPYEDAQYRFRVLPVFDDGGGVWSPYQYFFYEY